MVITSRERGASAAVSIFCLLLAGAFPLLGQATASEAARQGIGRLDSTPAATVLLPYFEVDLADDGGVTTLVALHNSDPRERLVHVVLWSDLGVGVLSFNVYLTGYDRVELDLREMLAGNLPQTGVPSDAPGVSPVGPLSQSNPGLDLTACGFQLPPPPLPASFVTYLRNALTGHPSTVLGGLCAGVDHGDDVARGYLTADTVRRCTLRGIADAGYVVDGGGGTITNDNVLWGSFLLVDPAADRALAGPLVHVEARGRVGDGFWKEGDPTFYGPQVGFTAIDNREPLPTLWAAPFNGGSAGSTDLVAWRDPGRPVHPFPCGELPEPFPLDHPGLLAFDDQETPTDLGEHSPFPWAVTRASVAADLGSADPSGWVWIDAGRSAYVLTWRDPGGAVHSGHGAIPLDNGLNP